MMATDIESPSLDSCGSTDSSLSLPFLGAHVEATALEMLQQVRREIADSCDDPSMTIARVMHLVPDLDKTSPLLVFHLRHREAVAAIDHQQYDHAMDIVRSSMTPLARSHPQMEKALIDLVWRIMYRTCPPSTVPHGSSSFASPFGKLNPTYFASYVFTSVSHSLQLPEPHLNSFLRYLLAIHAKQFSGGVCDRFERLFRIPELRRPDALDNSYQLQPSNFNKIANEVDSTRPSGSDRGIIPDAAPPPPQITDDEIREIAITTLMEVMQYPRQRAVDLLRQTDYDIDAVFTELI